MDIIEQNVSLIRTHTDKWEPHRGWVKWFLDELGQTWVKFYIASSRVDATSGEHLLTCHVLPAYHIDLVTYEAKREGDVDLP